MDKVVFSVYLGNPDNDNGTTLDLPAKPWELLDALERLRLREGQEPYWQVEDLGRYDFLESHLDKCDLYQFNALAEQLSTFNEADAIAFEGLVQMESDKLHQENGGELTIQRMLDLAYSVDCCHVVPEVRDDTALGKFYAENDFLPELEKVPDKVLELLDYAKIGRTMRQGEQSVITPHGYVERHSELKQAPADLCRPPRKPAYMMRFLCSNEHQTMSLNLPASQAELNAVLMRLDLDSWQEVYLECEDNMMYCVREKPVSVITELKYMQNSREEFETMLRALKDKDFAGKDLAEELELTQISFPPAQAEEISAMLMQRAIPPDAQRAAMFFLLHNLSYNGLGTEFAALDRDWDRFEHQIIRCARILQHIPMENRSYRTISGNPFCRAATGSSPAPVRTQASGTDHRSAKDPAPSVQRQTQRGSGIAGAVPAEQPCSSAGTDQATATDSQPW